MNKYRIKFKVNGEWKTEDVEGEDMEACLKDAKASVIRRFGKLGSIAIASDQGDGVFAF